jgi:FdhD protein
VQPRYLAAQQDRSAQQDRLSKITQPVQPQYLAAQQEIAQISKRSRSQHDLAAQRTRPMAILEAHTQHDLRTATVSVQRYGTHGPQSDQDLLAVEEPLEIRLEYGPLTARSRKSISITMRTPGNDFALAAGFLFGEQIIQNREQIAHIRYCGRPIGEQRLRNVVRVALQPNVEVDLARLDRHFYTTSSCGVCGKSSIEALGLSTCPLLPHDGQIIPAALIHHMPEQLRQAQAVFDHTGGLHAAALFAPDGTLDIAHEDVGRHNAVDKLIGERLLSGQLPLPNRILFVSGRASFELTQKAIVAGIPILAAVGAPSSLAVTLANEHQLTLIGFVRNQRFNVYTSPWRVTSVG